MTSRKAVLVLAIAMVAVTVATPSRSSRPLDTWPPDPEFAAREIVDAADAGDVVPGPRRAFPVDRSAPAAAQATEIRKVGASGVVLREQPRSASRRLAGLAFGEQVTVLDRQGGWLRIRRADQSEGWMFGRLLAEAPIKSAQK